MANLPNSNSSIICIDWDNDYQSGDLSLLDIVPLLEAEAQIRSAVPIPGNQKQVRANGLLVRSYIKIHSEQPTYSNEDSRVAASLVVSNLGPKGSLCDDVACPDQFLSGDIDSIAWTNDTWGLDSMIAPGSSNVNNGLNPRTFVRQASGQTLGRLDGDVYKYLAGGTVPDVVTPGAGFVDQAVALPDALYVSCGLHHQNGAMPGIGKDPATGLPATPQSSRSPGDKLTLGFPGGSTKEWTFTKKLELYAGFSAPWAYISYSFAFEFFLDAEGGLFLKGVDIEAFVNAAGAPASQWIKLVSGNLTIWELKIINGVVEIDNRPNIRMTFAESCRIYGPL